MKLFPTALLYGVANFSVGLLLTFLLHNILQAEPDSMEKTREILFANNRIFIVLAALIWAPLFETLIGQLLPVELLRRWNAPIPLILITCGAIFGVGHYFSNGLIHGIKTFVSGMLYGALYCRYRAQSLRNGYASTAIAHACTNLCALTASALYLHYLS